MFRYETLYLRMESKGIEIKFSEVLKKLRKRESINQFDLATNVKLDRSAIANYERGHRLPSVEVLVEISNFFGVSLDYLILGNLKNKLSKDSNNLLDQELMAENVALMDNQMNLQDEMNAVKNENEVLKEYLEAQKRYLKLLDK